MAHRPMAFPQCFRTRSFAVRVSDALCSAASSVIARFRSQPLLGRYLESQSLAAPRCQRPLIYRPGTQRSLTWITWSPVGKLN